MVRKKHLFLLFVLMFLIGTGVLFFRYYKELPKSKVLVKKVSVKILEDGTRVITTPIAALPPQEETSEWDSVSGKVIKAPNNPQDNKSNEMIAINDGKETIVVTNLLYVRTLEYFYMGKNVKLLGKWRKNAVIYGRSYRSFWVEDIGLNDKRKK